MYIYITPAQNPWLPTKMKKAIVNTKSNYRGLNGQVLDVVEVMGTRVSCKVWAVEHQKFVTVDFNLKEIVTFKN